ncbi:hypothetical protein [Alkalinema sp. FACHB-956]|uniref:hypothetical protein n=1 Tax=Alkalinema sp. FACHB-956 TaxID=2692768 RepID=UPI001689EDB0|nr:hypothetical protein [Alkalinema sp. FACHB-956]MBD2328758.1 hypothetical protein [Alkalinema sp. FACHB-956]
MNIIGRVAGGVLILLSFAWLASIVGIRPFSGTNQLQSNKAIPVSTNNAGQTRTGTTTANAPANKQAPANTSTVEANPRDAQQSQPGQKQQSANTGTTAGKTATSGNATGTNATGSNATGSNTTGSNATNQPAATTPVPAGW